MSPIAPPRAPRAAYADLFLISFLILFFELAAIRWFAGTVVFLTFFTNVVLLASFLGMSVGLLAARSARNHIGLVLPLALVSIALSVFTYLAYWGWARSVTLSLGDPVSPQLVYFGTEYLPADPSRWIVPMWAVGGTFFALIALTFVGLGQVMGRAFDAIPDRVAAYSVDVAGSLAGIAAFAAVSYLQVSPTVWYVPIVLATLYFAGWRKPVQLAAAAATLALVAIGAHALNAQGTQIFWSPYYKIAYDPVYRRITTNTIGHQFLSATGREGPAYLLPHLLHRDAGEPPFREAMIIGAGGGNDVAAALRAGVGRIDAVEIDPRIHELGRTYHPDKPYADARVAVHLEDGRSFLRRVDRKYDLAVYAIVDSLVLHSGYSSLRLENFLFTREAFQEVRRALKPDGVFVMYNSYRQGWVVGRLAKMAEQAFATPPLVISLPYQAEIGAGSWGDHVTFLLVSADPARLERIRGKFRDQAHFWVNRVPAENEATNGFRATAPAGEWFRTAPARVDLSGADPLPTDDWPQLYLRGRQIPWAPAPTRRTSAWICPPSACRPSAPRC